MIPGQPPGTGSQAVLRWFDPLCAVFPVWTGSAGSPCTRSIFAGISTGILERLICRLRAGVLLVLEDNGSGIFCHEGVWITANRFGDTGIGRGSLLQQEKEALQGLRGGPPVFLSHTFVIDFDATLPDMARFSDSAEW